MNDGEREIIDAAAKGLSESDCYADRAVCVDALTHIHDAGQSADRADVQIIEAVLSFTTERALYERICSCAEEDKAVRRCRGG